MGQKNTEDALQSMAGCTHGVLVSVGGGDQNINNTFGCRGFYVGTAGNVAMITAGGETLVVPLNAGWHPIAVKTFKQSGTTAANISAWW